MLPIDNAGYSPPRQLLAVLPSITPDVVPGKPLGTLSEFWQASCAGIGSAFRSLRSRAMSTHVQIQLSINSASKTAPRPDPSNALTGTMALMGAQMSFPRDAEIYGENEPADYLYNVIAALYGPTGF